MNFKVELTFLGIENKVSGKSGKAYFMSKFMDMKTSQIFEFYIPGDKTELASTLMSAKPLSPMPVKLKLSAFNGKPQIDIEGIA